MNVHVHSCPTSAMVSWSLDECGLDAGYLIGGVPIGLPGSARVGSTPFFVIEADEYDTSYFDRRSKFMHYQPDTLIFGNLEFAHAAIFANLAAIEYQFHHLLRAVPASGLIVAPSDDSNVNRVLEAGCWTPVETFAGPGATWRIDSDDVVTVAGAAVGKLELQLLGEHNRRNALAAMAAARHAGVPAANALAALGFDGIDEVRQGKYIEIDLAESDRSLAEGAVEAMCAKLLANPVIENYSIAIED